MIFFKEVTAMTKQATIGLMAHVDAGKTTLAEGMLYQAGTIRQAGRVDLGNTFLDPEALEKQRGITIFDHQAELVVDDWQFTLLDTPGHVDFAPAVERVLAILDLAVLVVSASDGIQSHTRTLWELLAAHQVPTCVFINKIDQAGAQPAQVLADLQAEFGAAVIPFNQPTALAQQPAATAEAIAMQGDEAVLDEYLTTGTVPATVVTKLVAARQVVPVYFGAALHQTGVQELLQGLTTWTPAFVPASTMAARVFKISHAADGTRLTWLRVLGDELVAKQILAGEKADQLRRYNGAQFQIVPRALAGEVVAVAGPQQTYPGQGLGASADAVPARLRPVLNYAVQMAAADFAAVRAALTELADEEPLLHLLVNQELGTLTLQLMGEVQVEVLTALLKARFGLTVTLVPAGIVYRETITAPVEGVGHYEPLRHYAEAHLLLEPGAPGSGVQVATATREEVLAHNLQSQVLAALRAKEHRGVLIGAPLTDVKITLVGGRGHLKHTSGGDFRQATWRAVRQGLMILRAQGKVALLEPWYDFTLRLPAAQVGRALTDVQRFGGSLQLPAQLPTGDELVQLTGRAPVAALRDYPTTVRGYTHGRGQLAVRFGGFHPAQDPAAIEAAANYDPVADLENPPGSVFCAHGAGYPVAWDQVPQAMHCPYFVPAVMAAQN